MKTPRSALLTRLARPHQINLVLKTRPWKSTDLPAILKFTDVHIGMGYYTLAELEDMLHRSEKNGTMCSLVLENSGGDVKGIRISFPPGQWLKGKGQGLCPENWPHPLSETAYFQSIFIASDLIGQGWGGKLSREALELLRRSGARGVVCHSWKESPHNSSTRYLQKLGFQIVAEHPAYWKNVKYDCPLCAKPPCRCTAIEMYYDMERVD